MSKLEVTIIIPIYSDWGTIRHCIDSIVKSVDKKHKVLIINDSGPEADLLEGKVKKSIYNHSNVEYHRNPKNLGFVKTCNKAVFDLDKSDNDILLLNSDTVVTEGFLEEMLAVLYLDKSHGAVSPRSNSATHASIPFHSQDSKVVSPSESYKIFKKVNNLLPRFYESVDAPGFCMLTRRKLITKFGLFDEIYSPGYAEETDYCMRLRKNGFKSLFANHAYVFHYRAETFTSERKAKLKARNKQILFKRYPNVELLVEEFIEKVNPIETKAMEKISKNRLTGKLKNLLKVKGNVH